MRREFTSTVQVQHVGYMALASPAFLEPERTVLASFQPRSWTSILCIGQLRQLL